MDSDAGDKVRRLLADAIEQTPTQREAFVRQACGSDAELLIQVRGLLAAHDSACDWLAWRDLNGGGEPASSPVVDRKPAADLQQSLLGTRIGPYLLVGHLGEGGFGTVFLAEQAHPVRRRVALKVIKLGMDTRQVIARFEAERQALAMMEHPNIAKVFDAGATPSGQPYFVMELVEGVSITRYCDQNRLDTDARLKLFISVCRAVQHAHQKGIIHRDLKPSNVMVSVVDGMPVPKVIDFGVAKATLGPLTGKTLFTEAHQLIGTPEYMSPEQAQMSPGATGDVDTRSDIYSLGVLLYELLTGVTPFDSDRLRGAPYVEIQRIVREVDPPRPSTRVGSLGDELAAIAVRRSVDPGKLAQRLRGELDWIVMRAMEKDRSRRYETASMLGLEVTRYLDDEPVLAGPPTARYRLWKLARRHKAPLAAAAAVALALTAGLGVASFELLRARTALTRVVHAERIAEQRSRAETQAKADAIDKLWNSYLAQARAGRLSRRPGQRLDGLRVIADAARIRPALELRNEAIACMALPDLKLERTWKGGVADRALMVFDPSLDRYARSDPKGSIHICRSVDDRELISLPGQGGPLAWSMAFSPDGHYLAAAYPQGEFLFQVWDLAKSRVVLRLPGRALAPNAMDFSPDSKSIALDAAGGRVELYELATGGKLRSLAVGGLVERLRFRPQGDQLAASVQRVGIEVLSADKGEILTTLHPAGAVERLAWDPKGKLLAAACRDRRVYVWDAITGERQAAMDGHLLAALRVEFSHSGRLLLSTGWDYTARLWDPMTGVQWLSADAVGYSVQFDPEDRRLGVCTASVGQIWQVEEGGECRTLGGPPSDDRVWAVQISPDGRLVACGSRGGVRVWDVPTGRELAHLNVPAADYLSVFFAPDGRSLLTSGSHGAERWPMVDARSTGGELSFGAAVRVAPANGVAALGLDGRTLLFVAGDGHPCVIDLDRPPQVVSLGTQPGQLRNLAVSVDGRWGATSARRGTGFRIWDLVAHSLAKEFPSSSLEVNMAEAAFSPDGRWVVTGDVGAYRFWQVGTWRLDHSVIRESPLPAMISFTSDGTMMAVITRLGQSVQLLEPASGKEIATLEDPQPHLPCWLSFSRDGSHLAVANQDHAVTLWDLGRIRRQLAAMNLNWDAAPEFRVGKLPDALFRRYAPPAAGLPAGPSTAPAPH